MKAWKIATIVFIFLVFCPSKVFAEGILFQDDFSQNSLSNWQVMRNQQWTDVSKPCLNLQESSKWFVQNGQMGIVLDGPSCTTTIVPRFLNLEHISNYQYDFDLKMSETTFADRGFVFSWHDTSNWYGVKLFDGIVILHNSINNKYEVMENSYRFPFFRDQTYHFTVSVKNYSQISLRINGELAFEFADTPNLITGYKTIGFEASNGTISRSVSFYDNVVVRSLDLGINLGVPLIKQTDPQWQDQEYDSATKWAEHPQHSGIDRWGCALTSMLMIMRYYGINFLPDGNYLNPISLNNWLKSQPDGYVGEGYLNWLAVSRLTKLISTRYNTPKLEFKRVKGEAELAEAQIEQQRPVILRIDGHFLVADGINTVDQDLLIKDPAYSFSHFKQHQKNILAIETFTPSYTDLSYLFMAHQPGLVVRLLDEKGVEISDFADSGETIQEFNSGPAEESTQTTKTIIEHLLAKPANGTYVLEISTNKPGNYPFSLFTYDQEGNAQNLSQSSFFSNEPKYFLLTYSKNSPTLLKPFTSFSTFRQDLSVGKDLGLIQIESAKRLDTEATFAEFSGTRRQLRFVQLLQEILVRLSNSMTQQLSLTLQKDLADLNEQLNVIISR